MDKTTLLERLESLDDIVDNKFDIVAVGGTSMVLYGLKDDTRDVDFIVENGDPFEFKYAYSNMFDHLIDVSSSGQCFQVDMPSDYMNYTEHEKTFENITLYRLSLLDLVITKSSRLIERDLSDVSHCRHYINNGSLIERLHDFSLTTEQMNNVKTALIKIFGVSVSDVKKL